MSPVVSRAPRRFCNAFCSSDSGSGDEGLAGGVGHGEGHGEGRFTELCYTTEFKSTNVFVLIHFRDVLQNKRLERI